MSASEMGRLGAAVTNAKLTRAVRSAAAKRGWKARKAKKVSPVKLAR